MPITRRLDESTQVLWTTISGQVTLEDLREHFAAVHEIRGGQYRELVDGRAVTGVAFGARDLPKLAEYGRQLFADGPIAPRAIAVTGVIYFGLARLFASFASSWVRISVFEDFSEAQAWIEMMVAAGV